MTFYWIICKDLASEFRGRQAWPTMLLVGIVATFLLAAQLDALVEGKERMLAIQTWVLVYLAGMHLLHRTIAEERSGGRWDALRLYPIDPAWIYAAKLTINFLALTVFYALITCLSLWILNSPVPTHPWRLGLSAVLGVFGIAAVGTLLGGLQLCCRRGALVLTGLTCPIVGPVILAASEATRMALGDAIEPAWRLWIQLLAVFDVVFATLGILLFESISEE